MALNQFGAIMTFAIEMEARLAAFYEQAAAAGGPDAEELRSRAQASEKRRKRIEQSRRENVTEITLEPITGLDEADYALELTAFTPQAANAAEETVQRFYADAAPKINVREAQQVLKRCLKEHRRLEPLTDGA